MLKPDLKKVTTAFSQEELIRYSRHFTLPEVGTAGQEKLKAARVLCVGAGGLGSPLLLYLAAAGVGTLGIIDDDVIDLSNLQRQVLYTTADINNKKIAVAKARLASLNPHLNIITYDERLTKQNALTLLQNYDVVADGSDNFATRYLVNDACFHLQKPNVHASIFQFEGQCSVFNASNGPCYRCLYEAPPPVGLMPNCAEGGVLGVLPGFMGTMQAIEVIKLILGIGNPLIGRLLTFDALALQFQEYELQKNPNCILCVHHQPFATLPHHDAVTCSLQEQNLAAHAHTISVQQLLALRQQQSDFILLDVREPHEYAIGNLGGYLIPLAELPNRLHELDKDKQYIVHCKAGPRSRQAVKILQDAGFKSVKHLAGGLLAWTQEVDTNTLCRVGKSA